MYILSLFGDWLATPPCVLFTPCVLFSWQKTQSFVLSTHLTDLVILYNKSPEPHMALWSYHELCEPQSVSSVPPSVQRTSLFLFSHNQLTPFLLRIFTTVSLSLFVWQNCSTFFFFLFHLFFYLLFQKTCFSTHSSNKETLILPCFHTFTVICSVSSTLLFQWLSKHSESQMFGLLDQALSQVIFISRIILLSC